jgi:hypothetical protein
MHVFIAAISMGWHQFVFARPNLKHVVLIWRHRDAATAAALLASHEVALKVHHPSARLVGAAEHGGYGETTLSQLWMRYGEGCGASSWEDLRRTVLAAGEDDAVVGFVRLSDLAFLPVDHPLSISIDIEDVAVPVTDEPDSPVRELLSWYRDRPADQLAHVRRGRNLHLPRLLRHRIRAGH